MPFPLSYIKVNGRRFSHASARVKFGSFLCRGLKEISYKDNVERGSARGAGSRQILGMTAGQYAAEASCTMFREEWEAFKGSLGRPVYDASFPITVTLVEAGQPAVVDTIQVFGIKEVERSSSDGNDPHEVKLSFDVAYILDNGAAPFAGLIR